MLGPYAGAPRVGELRAVHGQALPFREGLHFLGH